MRRAVEGILAAGVFLFNIFLVFSIVKSVTWKKLCQQQGIFYVFVLSYFRFIDCEYCIMAAAAAVISGWFNIFVSAFLIIKIIT